MPKDNNINNKINKDKNNNKNNTKLINIPNELINTNNKQNKEIKEKKEPKKIKVKKIIESDEESYDDPLKPKQDKLTKEEIMEILKDYKKVEDNSELKIGTQVKYFNIDKGGELKFRMGGEIMLNNGLPDYVILVSGKIMWSVQVKTSIFYRRLSYDEIIEPYKKKLLEKEKEIQLLKDIISNMKKK
jgi:hypothetical protein